MCPQADPLYNMVHVIAYNMQCVPPEKQQSYLSHTFASANSTSKDALSSVILFVSNLNFS